MSRKRSLNDNETEFFINDNEELIIRIEKIEDKLEKILERLAVAEVDGRNPIAIQGKFDNIFQLHNDLRDEFDDFKIKSNIKQEDKKCQ